jgi:hypothetical protein
MKFSFRSGALVAAVACGAGLIVPFATSAGAALTPTVACSKVSAPKIPASGKLTSTFASCTPALLAAGGTSIVAVQKNGPQAGKIVSTITWKNGKGTTKSTYNYKPAATKGKCVAPYDTRVTITGKILSSTGAAKIIKVGEPVNGSICAITTGANLGKSVNEPGTKFKM